MPDINYFDDSTFLRDIKRCFVVREMQAKSIKEIIFKYDIEKNTFYMDIMQNTQHMQYEYKVKKYVKTNAKKRMHSPEIYKSNKKIELEDGDIQHNIPKDNDIQSYDAENKMQDRYVEKSVKEELQDLIPKDMKENALSNNSETLKKQDDTHILRKQIEHLLNVNNILNSENNILAETLEKMDNEMDNAPEALMLDYTDDIYCRELYENLQNYQKKRYISHKGSIDKMKIILEEIMNLFKKYGFSFLN